MFRSFKVLGRTGFLVSACERNTLKCKQGSDVVWLQIRFLKLAFETGEIGSLIKWLNLYSGWQVPRLAHDRLWKIQMVHPITCLPFSNQFSWMNSHVILFNKPSGVSGWMIPAQYRNHISYLHLIVFIFPEREYQWHISSSSSLFTRYCNMCCTKS